MMSVAAWSGTLIDWKSALVTLKDHIAPALGRSETRFSAGAFIDGLLSEAERKTGWMLAEEAGFERPYRIQSLLGRSFWSADHLRDLVRDYVIEALGCSDGVLVIDETGFLKKGRHSVGVGRQYSGTAGRIENSQIGVFACYASRFGHALIDRQLYLPKGWAADEARRQKAHVPDEVTFATKPAMARDMIARTLDAGLPCAWVLADALYGADSKVRRMLENRRQAYVLATRSNHTLRFLEDDGLVQTDPVTLAEDLDADAWSPLSAGEGTKGPRLYGSMNGRGCRSVLARTTAWHVGYCFEEACAIPKRWLITSFMRPRTRHLQTSPAPQACDGPSRNASCAPRTILVSIIVRPDPGMAGIAI